MNLRAWQSRNPLRLNERERLITLYELTGWAIPVCVGIISLVLAMILPRDLIDWSGCVYFSVAIFVPCTLPFASEGFMLWQTFDEPRRQVI